MKRCPSCRGELRTIGVENLPEESFVRRRLVDEHFLCEDCGGVYYGDGRLWVCKFPEQDLGLLKLN
jgi:uncharacterized protein with PIN domain